MKRGMFIAIVAIAALLVGQAVWASGGGEATTTVPGAGSTAPITLKAFVDFNPNPWGGWGTDPVTKEITKRTGVSIDIQLAGGSDHAELTAMMASNALPDFVVFADDGSLRPKLWKQGFVQPLNKLMDKYAPTMRKVVPKDMDKIYTEDDGNWYYTAGYYADVERCLALKGTNGTVSGVVFSMPRYKGIGSPKYATLEDYRQVLKAVQKQYPDVTYYAYDDAAGQPTDDTRNMAQLINRVYGGQNFKAVAADGSVHLNYRDATYLQALKFINSLFRDGLFNAENFTITTDAQRVEAIKGQKMFSIWGQAFNTYKYDFSLEAPYLPVAFPQEPGKALKLHSAVTVIGGWPMAAISSTTKSPDRAIRYFEFMLSDEGQMLTYHGIEGKDYTMVEDMPKNMPDKDAMWQAKFSDVQGKLGIINYCVAWMPTNWADMRYYYWLNQGKPAYKINEDLTKAFVNNERMQELIRVGSDSDEKVIETKVFQLWTTALPTFYLAKSEAELVQKYNDFIAQADKLGAPQLEAAYTKDYKRWKGILGM
jgi:putative aldouronate transport system substrate-binding protein